MLPSNVETFRNELRRDVIPPHYSGRTHFAFTNALVVALIALAASRLVDIQPREWIIVPAAFFIANFIEYFAHRSLMHKNFPGLRAMFRNHSLRHHRFFTHEAMGVDSHRDFQQVLFDRLTTVVFLASTVIPIGALIYYVLSPNCAFLFAVTGLIYFLNYEWLHLVYHLAPNHRLSRLPIVRNLSRRHTLHHDPRHMARANFNITYPFADWIFRTNGAA